jgi:hypothetical protein
MALAAYARTGSSKAASEALGIGDRALASRLSMLNQKLQVRGAIEACLALGWIAVPPELERESLSPVPCGPGHPASDRAARPTAGQLRAFAAYLSRGSIGLGARVTGLTSGTVHARLHGLYTTLRVADSTRASLALGWLRVPEALDPRLLVGGSQTLLGHVDPSSPGAPTRGQLRAFAAYASSGSIDVAASVCGLARGTVRVQLRRLYKGLGVTDGTQACRALGWLTVPVDLEPRTVAGGWQILLGDDPSWRRRRRTRPDPDRDSLPPGHLLGFLAAYAASGTPRAAATTFGVALSTLKNGLADLNRMLRVHRAIEACMALGWLTIPKGLEPVTLRANRKQPGSADRQV